MRVRKLDHPGMDAYSFACPGCLHEHMFVVSRTQEYHATCVAHGQGTPCWEFNGDLERPTFSPSLLVRWDFEERKSTSVCHSYVRGGQIQFLMDCTHELKGQTVDLADIE
jgi:hypothetical protein